MTRIQKSSEGRPCAVAGCKRRYRSRGYCELHYRRAIKDGTLKTASVRKGAWTLDELLSYTTPGANGCMEWTRSRNTEGYGNACLPGQVVVKAHRLAYELAHGQPLPGLFVCHTCDNPPCIYWPRH